MKSINNIKTLSMTASAALALCVSSGPVLAEDMNPFGVTELKQGYQVAVNDGKADEGKCGGSKAVEGKCGEGKAKKVEGKGEGNMPKTKEGKCGEGKCGGSKPDA